MVPELLPIVPAAAVFVTNDVTAVATSVSKSGAKHPESAPIGSRNVDVATTSAAHSTRFC